MTQLSPLHVKVQKCACFQTQQHSRGKGKVGSSCVVKRLNKKLMSLRAGYKFMCRSCMNPSLSLLCSNSIHVTSPTTYGKPNT